MVLLNNKLKLSYMLLPLVFTSVSSIVITANAQEALPNIEIHLDALDDDSAASSTSHRKQINRVVLPEGAPFATESSGTPPKKPKHKLKKIASTKKPEIKKEANGKAEKAFVPIAAPSPSDFHSDKSSNGEANNQKPPEKKPVETPPKTEESVIKIPEPVKAHTSVPEPVKPVQKESEVSAPEVSAVDKEEAKKALAPIPELKNVNEVPQVPVPPVAVPEPTPEPTPSPSPEAAIGVPTPPVADFAKGLNEPTPTTDPKPETIKTSDVVIPKASIKPSVTTAAPTPAPAEIPPMPSGEPLPEPSPTAIPAPPNAVQPEPKPAEVQPAPIPTPQPTAPIAEKDKNPSSAPTNKPETSVEFLSTETTIPLSVEPELKKIASKINANKLRVSLIAYASSQTEQTTMARRVSLSRALAVRAFLIEHDVEKSTINVQAEGTKDDGGKPDRVDIFLGEKSN